LNTLPVARSTCSATILNDISLPAPGPLGKITVIGRWGDHAPAKPGNKQRAAKIFLIDISIP